MAYIVMVYMVMADLPVPVPDVAGNDVLLGLRLLVLAELIDVMAMAYGLDEALRFDEHRCERDSARLCTQYNL